MMSENMKAKASELDDLSITLLCLQTALEALDGNKPTEGQMNLVARLSGAAVAGIMRSLVNVAKAYGETEH